jgi:hypothetical protein
MPFLHDSIGFSFGTVLLPFICRHDTDGRYISDFSPLISRCMTVKRQTLSKFMTPRRTRGAQVIPIPPKAQKSNEEEESSESEDMEE